MDRNSIGPLLTGLICVGILAFVGCQLSAQTGGLSGTYIFHSQGVTAQGQAFYESGTHTYNPDGTQCTTSVMNVLGVGPSKLTNICGHYTFDPVTNTGQGGDAYGDHSSFAITQDRQRIYGVNNDSNGIWTVEAIRQ